MSRTYLKELDDLEGILANGCFPVDREKFTDNGQLTIDRTRDCLSLQVGMTLDTLSSTRSVELQEEKHQGVNANLLKKVTVTDLHLDSLVLKPDHFAVQHFKPKTWNKACDYLILTVFNQTRYALFVDLKTSLSCLPDDQGKLKFRGLAYHEALVWQMLGADALFDELVDVVYKNTCGRNARARSHASELTACGKTPLAKYRRRYLVLYRKVNASPNTTEGGIQPTQSIVPNDFCLEKEVKVLNVADDEKKAIGALLGAAEL